MVDPVRIEGASLSLGGREVLREVSWTVRRGEHWVVLGPNGAGKTSLLNLLSARVRPTLGSVRILGTEAGSSTRDTRIRVGIASDTLANRLFEGERVEDVVLTASYGTTSRQGEQYEPVDTDRAGDLLTAFELDGVAGREYGTLSEGERQRLLLARSLMSNPDLLLLDEPTAGLDLKGRGELLDALSVLTADSRSPVLVLVTHRLEDIPPGFTHALVLSEGRVLGAGPIEETLVEPVLSEAYGVRIELTHIAGRWSARRADPPGGG